VTERLKRAIVSPSGWISTAETSLDEVVPAGGGKTHS
jgi:hypothetical protein